MAKLAQQEFYCVKCRKKVKLNKDNIYLRTVKNKRTKRDIPMLSGSCNKCGTSVHKFVKKSDVPKLAKKFKVL